MDDQELLERSMSAPNAMPYTIQRAVTGQDITVHFEQLSPRDAAELLGIDWSTAVFRDVWLSLVDDEQTLKLISAEKENPSILGLVRIGKKTAAFRRVTEKFIWKRLRAAGIIEHHHSIKASGAC